MRYQLSATVTMCLLVFVSTRSSYSQSLVEIRPIVDSLQPGVVSMQLERSRHSFLIAPSLLLNLGDVDSAMVRTGTSSRGTPFCELDLRFKSALTDSVYHLTKTYLHKRIAILVDGRFLSAPMIMNPIPWPRLLAQVPSLSDAHKLASKINEELKQSK
jgi:preprotein translocase subunit SecD